MITKRLQRICVWNNKIAIKDGKFLTIWRLTVEPQKEETPDLSAFTPVADNVIRRSGRHFSRLIETCAVHQILNVHFTFRYPPLCQIYSSTEIRTSLFNVRCAKYTGRWSTLMGTTHSKYNFPFNGLIWILVGVPKCHSALRTHIPSKWLT